MEGLEGQPLVGRTVEVSVYKDKVCLLSTTG